MLGHSICEVLQAVDLFDGEPLSGEAFIEKKASDRALTLAAKAEDVIFHHYRTNLKLFLTHLFTVTENARGEEDDQLSAVENWFDKELESDTLQFHFNI